MSSTVLNNKTYNAVVTIMTEALKGITQSKKFMFGVIALLVIAFNNKLGLELDPEQMKFMTAIVGATVLGQGVADLGKEKAKQEAKNGKL